MYLNEQQLYTTVALSIALLGLIIRLVQKGRLDIAYSWLWLGIGIGTFVIALRYDIISKISGLIGSLTDTTTVFLIGFFIVLLMCLQFSLIISAHRRQIKKLTQDLAMLQADLDTIKKQKSKEDQSLEHN